MTVLRSGISAHTTVVTVDAPLSNPSYPLFYDLDSETIKVVDGADTTEWQVERGVADTQQARHAKSVQLVANANPYGGGGGGVSVDNGVDPPVAVTSIVAAGATFVGDEATLPLSLRRLGPYTVSFDDAGLLDDGEILTDFPEGALIIWAKAYFTTSWNSAGAADLYLQIANSGISQTSTLTRYDAKNAETFPYAYGRADTGIITGPAGALAGSDSVLIAQVLEGVGATASQGEAIVYALITIPS